jgi:SAM-dependent methyltransferase
MLCYKIKEILKDPGSWHCFVLGLLRRSKVKKVRKDGRDFYEYEHTLYPSYLNQGNASSYIKNKALRFCKGQGIDVGAGYWVLPGAIAVQNDQGQNALRLDRFADHSLDFCFSSHCLEHLSDWKKALKLWTSKLKPGGILFLYLPHPSMKLWNRAGPWVGGHHKWVPTYQVIAGFLENNGMEVIEYNPDKDEYWSFHIVAKKNPTNAAH